MSRPRIVLFSIAVAAAVVAPCWLQYRAHTRLRALDEVMRQQAERLAQLERENSRLAGLAGQGGKSSALTESQLAELLKLRSEVSGLRRQTNAIQKLQADNQRLRTAAEKNPPGSEPEAAPEIFTQETWTFAGYATPEASIQSFFWGMNKGDMRAIQGSLTESAAANFAETYQRRSQSDSETSARISREASRISGFQIVAKEMVSADEMLLLVTPMTAGSTNNNRSQVWKGSKIGGEWKFTGPQ